MEEDNGELYTRRSVHQLRLDSITEVLQEGPSSLVSRIIRFPVLHCPLWEPCYSNVRIEKGVIVCYDNEHIGYAVEVLHKQD